MNHDIFIQNWLKIKSRKQQMQYMKDYMLSLSAEDLMSWIKSNKHDVFSQIQSVLNNTQSTKKDFDKIGDDLDKLSKSLEVIKTSAV
jgi:methyl-accepting chemotaxis protein